MEIKIFKSRKQLEVWESNTLQATYPIGIGKSEKGHKEREGDMRTPEGQYRVCVKNPQSKYYLSLGVNYPNNLDAKNGIEKGTLSDAEFTSICQANDANKRPPWDTPLGGEIFIHGELEKQDWSHGCVRLNDIDMKALFGVIQIGVKVTILP